MSVIEGLFQDIEDIRSLLINAGDNYCALDDLAVTSGFAAHIRSAKFCLDKIFVDAILDQKILPENQEDNNDVELEAPSLHDYLFAEHIS